MIEENKERKKNENGSKSNNTLYVDILGQTQNNNENKIVK
jgi:hypothetical protein